MSKVLISSYADFPRILSGKATIELADTPSVQYFNIPLNYTGVRPVDIFIKVDDSPLFQASVSGLNTANTDGLTPLFVNLNLCSVSIRFISEGLDEDLSVELATYTIQVQAMKWSTNPNPTPVVYITYFVYADTSV